MKAQAAEEPASIWSSLLKDVGKRHQPASIACVLLGDPQVGKSSLVAALDQSGMHASTPVGAGQAPSIPQLGYAHIFDVHPPETDPNHAATLTSGKRAAIPATKDPLDALAAIEVQFVCFDFFVSFFFAAVVICYATTIHSHHHDEG